jgi:hypothetical protein
MAWRVTLLAGPLWALVLGDSAVYNARSVTPSIMALGGLAAGIAWARLYRKRANHPARAAALLERDRTWMLDRYHRAVEWNRVRAALLEPGTVAVVVGSAATLAGRPVGRRWTYNPRTGVQATRVISDEIPRGTWVVVDGEDRVVATAPAGAPEAWLDALRAGTPRPS